MVVSVILLPLIFIPLSICFILTILFYFYCQFSFKYWGRKNIPCDKPIFPFGSLKGIRKYNVCDFFKNKYEDGKYFKYFGIWFTLKPCLFINDPDLIKQILIKDFNSFHDRGMYYHEEIDPLSANLVTLEGEAWKELRAKLSPAFSPNKIKAMFPLIVECSLELIDLLRKSAVLNEVVDMKDISSRFTTDVISCCCFGIKGGSIKNPKTELRMMGKKLFEPSATGIVKNQISFHAPDFAKKIKMRLNPKEVENFFMSTFRQVMEDRKISDEKRNDLFQSLIELMDTGFNGKNKESSDNKKLSFEQLAAEAFVFFIGGMETSSITVQFALYELSMNQVIQEKARAEIKRVLTDEYKGEMTYEAIQDMKYLGQIVDETLRKYPPTAGVIRSTTKPYKIPESNNIIEKGVTVLVNTLGIQRDERYYPKAEIFDPDRFTDDKKASRHPCTYLPFGEGPRYCIGKNLALLELKVVLASLLLNFKFSLPDHYNRKKSVELDVNSVFFAPKDMNLKISLAEQ